MAPFCRRGVGSIDALSPVPGGRAVAWADQYGAVGSCQAGADAVALARGDDRKASRALLGLSGGRVVLSQPDGTISLLLPNRDPDLKAPALARAQASVRVLATSPALPERVFAATARGQVLAVPTEPGSDQQAAVVVADLQGVDIGSMALTPAGGLVLVGDVEGRVHIVEVDGGRLLGARLVHDGAVRSLRVSPDGTRVVSGGQDGRTRSWDLDVDDPEAWVGLACAWLPSGDGDDVATLCPRG